MKKIYKLLTLGLIASSAFLFSSCDTTNHLARTVDKQSSYINFLSVLLVLSVSIAVYFIIAFIKTKRGEKK